jgi:hypothetical protein
VCSFGLAISIVAEGESNAENQRRKQESFCAWLCQCARKILRKFFEKIGAAGSRLSRPAASAGHSARDGDGEGVWTRIPATARRVSANLATIGLQFGFGSADEFLNRKTIFVDKSVEFASFWTKTVKKSN